MSLWKIIVKFGTLIKKKEKNYGAQKGKVIGKEWIIGGKVDIPLLEKLHAIGNQILATLQLLWHLVCIPFQIGLL